jgi:transcriptional regulator with XRE-family HTH domain
MTDHELREARLSLGLSQQALGDALGMSRENVSRMEAGKKPIERRTELAVRYLLLVRHGNPASAIFSR